MNIKEKPIFVTQPSLPPLNEFLEYLSKIWDNKILTNNGPLHQRFEHELANYLGVKYLSLFTNGTIALITALKALNISGEVITTPFSFVATTHSLYWNNLIPVFADIEQDSFNIDPREVEKSITSKTRAILPVHIFGNPCKVDNLKLIAEKYNLKIVYDAAHVFDNKIRGESLLNYGDMSVLSFHATKLFNTCEGGAIICHDRKTKERLDLLKNFGFKDEVTIIEQGLNGKMNEIQAALGLLQLQQIDLNNQKCESIAREYRIQLDGIKGLFVPKEIPEIKKSYSYFPILIDSVKYGSSRDLVYEKLKRNYVFSRRYFYPLISNIQPYNRLPSANPDNLRIANQVAGEILCLPIYPDLSLENVSRISKLLRN